MRFARHVAPSLLVALASVAHAATSFAQPPTAAPGPVTPEKTTPEKGPDEPPTAPVAGSASATATAPLPPTPPTPPPPSGDAPKPLAAELTSLKLLLAKGVISQAEYDAAIKDISETSGLRTPDGNTFVVGKWATTLYGFVEGDMIYDETQSLNEIAGNTAIAKPGTFAGDHDRMQFSIRNSRFGLRLKAPESNGIRASAQLEMDFFGTQLPFGGANPGTEAAVFNNSVLRVRHMNLKIETPIVDVLFGQYWVLFGWHAQYLPATVEIQGVPGGIFSRQVQLQISKTVKTSAVTFEAAIAALRPPQRDSGLPAGQGGLRLAINGWTAPQTANFTGTSIQPLSIAVTGDVRRLRLPEFAADPKETREKTGTSFAVDAFIPVIPGTKEKKGNSLALNGEASTGFGAADNYTSLTGGVSHAALPIPAGGTTAPAFDPKIDNGIGAYKADGSLSLVQWTAVVGGIQYYFPGSGNLFASANIAHTESSNTSGLGDPKKTRDSEDWLDVNLFYDMTPAVRLGAEYAFFRDRYNDGTHASNRRVQVSGAFLF
jgi:hypothetical protein